MCEGDCLQGSWGDCQCCKAYGEIGKGFDTAVEVIDVDTAVNHDTTGNNDDEWRTSKRCLSSDNERYTTTKKRKILLTTSIADVEHGNFDDDHLEEDHTD